MAVLNVFGRRKLLKGTDSFAVLFAGLFALPSVSSIMSSPVIQRPIFVQLLPVNPYIRRNTPQMRSISSMKRKTSDTAFNQWHDNRVVRCPEPIPVGARQYNDIALDTQPWDNNTYLTETG